MRANGLQLLMLLFPLAVSAQDEVLPSTRPEEALPSIELLEFLGEWDKADTGWIDQQLSRWMVLAAEKGNKDGSDDE